MLTKNLFLQILYILFLVIALLYPFNFDFKINHAQWLTVENGIHFKKRGQIISKGNCLEFYEKIVDGKGLTIEVWLKTDDLMQNGPARILSYSIDTKFRNFTLAQSEDKLVMRLRTQQTDLNGIIPHMEFPNIFQEPEKTHIILAYDFDRQFLFINGKKHSCAHIPKGNFSNWDPAFRLVIGNEVTGNRPWLGKIYYAAIYNQALDGNAVTERFKHGFSVPECSISDKTKNNIHPIVCYSLNERKGNLVKDMMGIINFDLYMPKMLPWQLDMMNIRQLDGLKNKMLSKDNFIHILLFIPFGFFLHQIMSLRLNSLFYSVIIVLIIGFLVSILFEILQNFLPGRTSSIIDIITNLIGACLGIVLTRFFSKRKRASFIY